MGNVLSIVLGIAKAIPGIIKILELIKESWEKYKEKKVSEHYKRKRDARKRLMDRLQRAKTDEERKEIADLLAIIDSDY